MNPVRQNGFSGDNTVEASPKDGSLHNGLANVLRDWYRTDKNEDHLKEAIAVYRRAAELEPTVPNHQASIGDVLVDLHELSPMSFYRTLPSGRPL